MESSETSNEAKVANEKKDNMTVVEEQICTKRSKTTTINDRAADEEMIDTKKTTKVKMTTADHVTINQRDIGTTNVNKSTFAEKIVDKSAPAQKKASA